QQWRFNGMALPGAITNPLVLTNVHWDKAGDYTVVVTNNYGAVTSLVARLFVMQPPSVLVPPANVTSTQGMTAILSAMLDGSVPCSYQWRFGGTNLPTGTG